MSSTDDVPTLWRHTQATVVLLVSELGTKLLLHYTGEHFLSVPALAVVTTVLNWFTVGTIILFVVSCFLTLLVMNAASLIHAIAACRDQWTLLKRPRTVEVRTQPPVARPTPSGGAGNSSDLKPPPPR
jgi:hypothetical protein